MSKPPKDTCHKDYPYKCQNCGREAPRHAMEKAVGQVGDRLVPGEVYTDQECPKCGALAHPVTSSK